jgi:hypothetical protein
MITNHEFRTVDFRPAPRGWRLVYATIRGPRIEPLPGWLIREEVEYDTDTYEVVARTGDRDVVPGHLVDGEIQPAHRHENFWHVLGPGQDQPSLKQTAAEMRRRAAHKTQPPAPGASSR